MRVAGYDRSTLEALDHLGRPIRVVRTSADAASETEVTYVSSPAFVNPSFATNTTGWTAQGGATFVRDTGVFDTSPASGKLTAGPGIAYSESVFTTTTGTFNRATTYAARVRVRVTVETANPPRIGIAFGAATADQNYREFPIPPNTWTTVMVPWVPKAAAASAYLSFNGTDYTGPAALYIDSLQVVKITPTLLDRRGFRRTKVVQINAAIDEDSAEQIADVFLAGHKTTPLKGTLTVQPGGLRNVKTGEDVHPSELLLHTGELIRLPHLVDPDTGGLGRDGVIAGVSYDEPSETATVTLDNSRDSLESLLARYALIGGAGR